MIAAQILRLVTIFTFLHKSIQQQIYRVSSRPTFTGSTTGSLFGGSTFYIKGAGFGGMESMIRVFVGTFECLINDYFTSDTFLVCQMPAGNYGNSNQVLNTQVFINDIPYTCSSASNCQVSLTFDRSPNIKAIVPQNIVGGQRIMLMGYFFTSATDKFKDVKIGQYNCQLDEDPQSLNQYDAYERFYCTVPKDIPSKDYTMVVTAAEGTGFATSYASTLNYKVGLEQTSFNLRIHPELEGLSSGQGFVDGQILTLSGNNFGDDPSKVTVSYKGLNCKILSVVNQSIKCELEADPGSNTDTNFVGGAGLDYRFYQGSRSYANLKGQPSYPNNNNPQISVTLNTENYLGLENYTQRMVGLFYAPVSGEYTFYLSSDDQSSIRISTTAFDPSAAFDENTLIEICSISAWTQFRSFYQFSTQRCSVTLQASNYYYFLVHHTEQYGGDHLSVGVTIPNSDDSKPNTKRAVKKLYVQNTPVREVVTYKILNATGGTYKIKFYYKESSGAVLVDSTTNDIAFDATASTVQSEIYWNTPYAISVARTYIDANGDELASSTNSAGFKYTITFTRYRSPRPLPYIVITNLQGAQKSWQADSVVDPSPPVDGTFQIQIDDAITSPINVRAGAQELQQALVKLPQLINGVTVHDAGDSYDGKTWYIRLDSLKTNPDFTIISTGVSGGPSNAPAQLLIDNAHDPPSTDLYFMPLPSDLLFTFGSAAEFKVKVGDYYAACVSRNCNYSILPSSSSPVIDNFSLSSETLTINLASGYDALPDSESITQNNLSVTFGKSVCTNINLSLPVITCSLPTNADTSPVITAGSHKPKVHLKDRGFFTVSAVSQSFPITVSSISPDKGSIGGGTQITITGTGFSKDSIVFINDSACAVVSAENTEIVCVTPPQGSTSSSAVLKIQEEATIFTQNGAFVYDPLLTPTISLIAPTTSSPVLKNDLVITAINLGNDISKLNVILKGVNQASDVPIEFPCNPVSLGETSLTCRLGGGTSGEYRIVIFKENEGYSISTSNDANKFKYIIEVTNITPQSGSKAGGQIITITGSNFSTILNQNQVVINKMFAEIISASATQITARVPALPPTSEETTFPIYVIGRVVEEAVCDPSVCTFTYDDNETPTVTAMTPLSGVAGTSVTIIGTKLNDQNVVIKLGKTLITNVSEITDTLITFTVPVAPYFVGKLSVFVTGKGNALITPELSFQNNFVMTTITPTTGSKGGNLITISGNGFDPSSNITAKVGSTICSIQSVTSTSLTCWFENLSSYSTAYSVSIAQNALTSSCDSCSYTTFASADTPKISSISSTSFVTPDSIAFTISGTLLGDGTSANALLISRTKKSLSYNGSITNNSGTLSLSFASIPVGDYKLVYNVQNVGFAQITTSPADLSINFSGSDFTGSTVQSSYAGGLSYTLSGKGLLNKADLTEISSIEVCGKVATITSSSYSSVTLTIPELVTVKSNELFNLQQNKKLTPKTVTAADNASKIPLINDGDFTTSFSSSSQTCWIKYDFGQNFKAQVSQIQMFPLVNMTPSSLAGALIEGSDDNTNWVLLVTVPTDVVTNWNTYHPEASSPNSWSYRYIRFSGKGCNVAELQVYGIILREGSSDAVSDLCNLDINMNGKILSLVNRVEYRSSNTPKVDSLSPAVGTTAGGTVVTITGSGFDPATSQVKFDGIACPIDQNSSTATTLVCTTGQRSNFVPPTMVISTPTGLTSNNENSFLYIDRWSDVATWGGESPPREGDSVYVPVGQNLLIDISPPKIYAMIVEGSVIFEDAKDLEFHASFITVKGGSLRIGTEDNPFTHKLTITLYGNYTTKQLPFVGNKNIAVHSGKLDIHGAPKTPSWTLLASSATSGSTVITLSEAVNWSVGDEIVIASTSFSRDEFERRFIVSISADNLELTLDAPLQYPHFAETLTYDNKSYEVRAEVAVLTRNVRVVGDETSDKLQYGAHIIMMGRDSGLQGRISNIEMTRCGQAFQMGRYPIHFHLAGNVVGSYIKNNSVHGSHNRGTTVHGVHFLTVENNVYLDQKGHCVFIEDSIESNNVIKGNLAMRTTTSASLLVSDLKPAAFWITRPKNFITHNHAAGSTHFGFWFDLPGNPTGPSATATICPSGEPLGLFNNNVAHTNGIGLRIYPIFIPRTNPCGSVSDSTLADPFSSNPPVIAEFTDNLLFGNGQGFFGRNLGAVQIKNTAFISNGANAVVAEPDSANYFVPRIEDCLFVGKVDSWHTLQGMQSGLAFGTPRKDGLLLKNIHFIDFPESSTMFLTCEGCADEMHRDIGARQTRYENLVFTNVNAKMIQFSDANRDKDIFEDVDGSLIRKLGVSTSTGGWILPYFKFLDVPECSTVITDTSLCSEKCIICDNTVTIRRVNFRAEPSDLFDGIDLKVLNYQVTDTMDTPDNFEIIKFRYVPKLNFRGWAIPFVSSYKYNIHWSTGVDFSLLKIENSLLFGANEAGFFLRTNNTYQRELYDAFFTGLDQGTFVNNAPINALAAAPTASDLFADYYYTNTTNTSIIRVDGHKIGQMRFNAVICRNYCPPEPSTTPIETQIRLWSNPSSWTSGRVPVAGDNVVVEAGWNMILDVDTAALAKLQIIGSLSFLHVSTPLTLNAKNIEVNKGGFLLIGNKTVPHAGKATINIDGDRTDPQIIIDSQITPATKSIVVKGNFTVYGLEKTPVTAKLASTALAGSSAIVVNVQTNWAVDDVIVISSSSRNPGDVDYVKIAAVNSPTSFTINPALTYNHYGSAQQQTASFGELILDMRAEVSVLTRNVVVKGTYNGNWGCRILAAGYENLDTDPVQYIEGVIDLNNLEIENCGQKDSSEAALDIRGVKQNFQNVHGCSIHGGLGWGIGLLNSRNISISNIIMSNQTKYGVSIENTRDLIFKDNVITKINDRLDYENEEFYDLIIGFYYKDKKSLVENNVTITNNIISSTSWFSWAVPGQNCDGDALNFKNNVGHSSRAGWFAMVTQEACMKYSDFIGYWNFDEGFVQRFSIMDVRVTRMLLADNDNSIAINGGDPNDSMFPLATFTNSRVYGQILKDCSFCYQTLESCRTSGLYTSLFENGNFVFQFEKNRLPLHNLTETDFLWGGRQNVIDVEFSDFRTTAVCSNSYAIRLNNFIQDTSVYVKFENVVLKNTDYNNRFFFFNHTRTMNPGFCSKRDCTGIYNAIIADATGGVFGSPKVFFGFNKPAGRDGNCTFEQIWNGHACNPVYSLLSIQQPEQARAVVITPLTINLYNGLVPNVSDDVQYLDVVDNERKIPAIVKKFGYHHLSYQGTMPNNVIYKLDSESSNHWAVFRIQHNDPATLVTVVNDIPSVPKIVKEDGTYDFSNPQCGDHVYFPSNRTIVFVVTAQSFCVVKVVITSALQLSLRINISPADFYKNNGPTTFLDNMAALLGIPISRIRIVGIRSGSTIVDTIILPTDTFSGSTQTSDLAQEALLTQYKNLIIQAVSAGTLKLGGEILDLTTSLSTASTVPSSNSGSSSSNTTTQIPKVSVCRYNSTTQYELKTIDITQFNVNTSDVVCWKCVDKSQCSGERLVTACQNNATYLGATACTNVVRCPQACTDYNALSYCSNHNGVDLLISVKDLCISYCSHNRTLNVSEYKTCESANCTLACSVPILSVIILLVTAVLIWV